jgi:hypothetical protein
VASIGNKEVIQRIYTYNTNQNNYANARNIYFNRRTRFKDLSLKDRISFEVPKKEKIIIQLPTISTLLTPAMKSFQNWKHTHHKVGDQSDQNDQKDEKLIQSILQECQQQQVIEEEVIDLDDLEELRNYGQIRDEFGSLSRAFPDA